MTRIPELQHELVRAAAANAAKKRRWRPAGRRRGLVIALAALALGGGAATAERLTVHEGPALSPVPAGSDGGSGHGARALARAGTGRIVATAREPDGSLPWGLRVARAANGMPCLAIGRVMNGALGVVDSRGLFRRLPVHGPEPCSKWPKRHELVRGMTGSAMRGPRGADPLPLARNQLRELVVFGLAGADVDRVEVRTPHMRRTLVPTAGEGGFITVVSGPVSYSEVSLIAHFRDGSVQRFQASK